MQEEKIRNIIDKCENKSGDYSTYKRFIFNSKDLPQELTVNESGNSNNSNIFIINKFYLLIFILKKSNF